jgi:hypothetical protein
VAVQDQSVEDEASPEYVSRNINEVLRDDIYSLSESIDYDEEVPRGTREYIDKFGVYIGAENLYLIDLYERRLQKVYGEEEELAEDISEYLEGCK